MNSRPSHRPGTDPAWIRHSGPSARAGCRLASIVTALLGLIALALATPTPEANAQALVYDLEIEPEDGGVNFEFFDRGFLVVPGQGGNASLIFYSERDGLRLYARADQGGRYFLAIRSNGQQRAVFSALVAFGGVEVAYLVHGQARETMRLNVNRFDVRVPVAPTLRGHLLASDDEADVIEPALDGSVGVAGSAAITARLNQTRTKRASDLNEDIAAVIAGLIEQLEARGFTHDGVGPADPSDPAEPDPEPTPDPDLEP